MSETDVTPEQAPADNEPITTIPVVEPLPDAAPDAAPTEAPKEEASA